jgi:Domain of unknown function (DUF4173)
MRLFALLAAFLAAAAFPHQSPGVDVPLVAVLVAAGVATGAARAPTTLVFGSLAIALTAFAAVLDAQWVVAVDLAAAMVLAALASAGPQLAALVAPLRALRDMPRLVPSTPLTSVQAARGVLLGSALVLPFGALFWTGDAAFAELGTRTAPSFSSLPLRTLVFGVVLAGALGLALAARATPPRAMRERATGALERLEWIIPIAFLDLLFLVFVLVQVTVLFGGHDHVLSTTGLTYAEYAREGFWQLIGAGALTFAVVGGTLRFARISDRKDLVARDVLLGLLVVLTLVVLASAVHRLRLYEDAYGLTRSRLAAESLCFALAGLFGLLTCARLVRPIRSHLPAVAVGCAAIALLAFSISNPDARVASRNVERWRDTGRLDVAYLQSLSSDAVPVLSSLPDPLRTRVLASSRTRLARDEPWTAANLSRHRARALLG